MIEKTEEGEERANEAHTAKKATGNAYAKNKRRIGKGGLRAKFAHFRAVRGRTARGQALADIAAAYPCHIERARACANGRESSPAMRAAMEAYFAARGLSPCGKSATREGR